MNIKKESFRTLIEQKPFNGRFYGFQRLKNLIAEKAIAEMLSYADISVSEIQRRVTPGKNERYFP